MSWEKVLFDGWSEPLRIVCMALLSYVFLVILLRLTGKRTLSKMNAFDLIITVASGSTFASVLLDKSISFVEGATAFTMLVLMQYGVAWASARSGRVEQLVKSEPTILVWQGEMLRDVMERSRVTEAEILAACRSAGVGSMRDVGAVVLEPAGEFSVITSGDEDAEASVSTLRTASRVAGG